MRAATLSLHNMHHYGDLYINYLKARHDVFIKAKGWDLPEVDGMEFDQYDTPKSRAVVVHEYGEILAGIRIAPTDAVCGNHSYMLRDAQLGLLPSIDPGILYNEAPVSPFVWEATRLFVSSATPASRRPMVQELLFREMSHAACAAGASHVIGIVPAIFKRWLKVINMDATAVGPIMLIDGDRVQAALMNVATYSA